MEDRAGTAVARLARRLLDDAHDPLVQKIEMWLASSRRFRAFAERHQDKIRQKLRGAPDAEARRNVRTELRVAHLLLADRRIELAFEASGSGRIGPDFTARFRGQRDFEAVRARRVPAGSAAVGSVRMTAQSAPAASGS